jgi:hypothetical protein
MLPKRSLPSLAHLLNPDPNPHHSFSSNHAQSSLSANQLYHIIFFEMF